ncbi:prophage Lp1 protein 51 [Streptococcus pneumoniae]|nr:prophage Lp1 protein 51 [Streptococcus pneumoniae]VLU68771.1 prophage Lp1 protein 51 [Streptococcus pneumoniae]VMJ57963.1 prophage Lp1 protein 51 [Streptococcus pneumoniae]
MITQIKEYIQFGDFNSKDAGWYLQSRDAPTPDKKEIVEQIPYLQGVLDFSDVLGEVFFDRREITYEFKLPNKDYPDRKVAERFIKSSMTTKSESQLFDTHDKRYYWLGKVKSIKVTDVPLKKHLIATIVFICYPFAFHVDNYFDDVWDTFDFENDFSNWTKWQINGQNEIFFINGGDTSVSPTVICSNDISLIDKKGKIYKFKKGENTDFVLSMKPGMNRFIAKGNGSISLRFNAEVMA